MSKKNTTKNINWKQLLKNPLVKFAMLLCLIIITLIAVFVAGRKSMVPEAPEPVVITETSIKAIIESSAISTFEAVYNGIAEVYNEKKPLEVDCYVSYNAIVKAGFDMKEVKLTFDKETNHVDITIPKIAITEIKIDETSLDYLFYNEKINQSGIFSIALKACQDDVARASRYQQAIFELASNNAKSFMEALIKPFLDSFDEEYTLTIAQEANER